MYLRQDSVNVLLFFAFVCGAAVFLYGYFPTSYNHEDRATVNDFPYQFTGKNLSSYRAHYTKTVFMVIDALRTDFVQHSESMKYINRMLNTSDACLLHMNVHSPTVTMPRIKAMTTGTIPNFVDVLLNFGSAALSLDSFVHQMYERGKIVFLGDDTWTKLFPIQFHRQLENRDSLFVNDFYQGDQNITKSLHAELKHADWELLILHYLGLDHIGHVEGPYSNKVPGKLQEMDNVAMRINLELLEWKNRVNVASLFIITGDHGMRDTGGHGGNSYAEVNVPFIVFGTQCTPSTKIYQQIDIAPTLSVLLGLPIPSSSIGTLIPELLEGLSHDEQLVALYYNTHRLYRKLERYKTREYEYSIQFNEATILHQKYLRAEPKTADAFKKIRLLYDGSAREMSHQLSTKFVKYDNLTIYMGVLLTSMSTLALVFNFWTNTGLSVSFKLLNGIVCLAVFLGIVQVICFSNRNEYGLCKAGAWNTIVAMQQLVFALYFVAESFYNSLVVLKYGQSQEKITSPITKWIAFSVFIHALSLASSSFVEEEHQTWYFITITLLLIVFVHDYRRLSNRNQSAAKPSIKMNVAVKAMLWYQQNYESISWAFLFAIHILLRRLNQTGDKWLTVPDVGDWLIMEPNRLWNSIFTIISLSAMVYNCTNYGGFLTNILTFTASALVYYYRTQTGAVYFAGIKTSDSIVSVTMFWLNILEIISINYIPVLYKWYKNTATRKDCQTCLGCNVVVFALISAMLHKPHNIILMVCLILTCRRVNDALDSLFIAGRQRNIVKTAAHFFIAKMFFFYQGNSNSLASLDINAGYIGSTSYNFYVVGLLMTMNTYSGLILSMLTLLYHSYDIKNDRSQTTSIINDVNMVLTVLVTVPISVFVFVAIHFKHHLFVWTVFSPKLIYEFFHLCLMFVIVSCTYVIDKLV